MMWIAWMVACTQVDGPLVEGPVATSTSEVCPPDSVADWDTVADPILTTWCTSCHGAEVPEADRQGAPMGVDFDSWEGAAAHAERIAESAGISDLMPPGGGMPDEDRLALLEWVNCRTPGPVSTEPAPTAACAELTYTSDPTELCDGFNALSGDLAIHETSDYACACAVDGDLDLREASAAPSLPDLTTVGGSLIANGAQLAELSLPALVDVGDDVHVVSNPDLQTVDLPRLASVGGSVILEDNRSLHTVRNLAALATVGGHLRIRRNGALTSLHELHGIDTVGGSVVVNDNALLSDLTGLALASEVGGNLIIAHNPALERITVGRLLDRIGGDLRITDNPALATVDPFWALTEVGGAVQITSLDQLQILPAFDALHTTGGIRLQSNASLRDIQGFPVLTTIRGDLVLDGMPELALLQSFVVEEITGTLSVGSMTSPMVFFVPELRRLGELDLHDNPGQWSMDGMTSLEEVYGSIVLRDNPLLRDLDGLVKLEHIGGDLWIIDNPTLSTSHALSIAEQLDSILQGEAIIEGNDE